MKRISQSVLILPFCFLYGFPQKETVQSITAGPGEISTHARIIKVYNPAPQWKRKTFNGLTQIIVRTTKQEGEITLTATSEGLAPATLKFMSADIVSGPSTEDIKR